MQRHLIEIRYAKIMWKNFSGAERKAMVNGHMQIVNEEGKRNFAVIIDPSTTEFYFDNERITDPDFGQVLSDMDYRISIKPGREEGENPQYRLSVEIRYPKADDNVKKFVPKIYMVVDGKPVLLDEDTIHELDECDIVRADIAINNSTTIDRATGEEKAKCWCNEGYFTIQRSRLSQDYDFGME